MDSVFESAVVRQVKVATQNLQSRPNVAVYADPLLSPTMTFVQAQARALRSFSPIYIGSQKYPNGLELPNDRTVVINDSTNRLRKIREIPFKVFGYAPIFYYRVREYHPVLVHAHFGPAGLTVMPLSKWLGVPLVVTIHGGDVTVPDEFARRSPSFRQRVYIRRKKALQVTADNFIAVSNFIRDRMLKQGFPPEKTTVLYTGIDTQFFSHDPGIPREELVLFVASMVENKGCEYLLRAMRRVQSILPRVKLVLIGDGPLRSSLEKMARETIRDFVFLGFQNHAVVKYWLNRAKVFSVPSIRSRSGDEEGFGMVMVEAQAMGVPVVSFASGGIPEAVEHGQSGLLAAEKDWESLAGNILCLLENGLLWQKMSESGRERTRRLFDLQRQTAKLECLYADTLRSFHGLRNV